VGGSINSDDETSNADDLDDDEDDDLFDDDDDIIDPVGDGDDHSAATNFVEAVDFCHLRKQLNYPTRCRIF
jgi:hypothetical protein